MPVFNSSRKVQVFGSSLAMTLPAMFAKACEIEKGASLNIYYDLDGVLVVTRCMDSKKLKDCLVTILQDIMRSREKVEDN